MSVSASVREVGLRFGDNPEELGAALTGFLRTLRRPPVLLGLGEPTHGVEAFPELRNEMLRYLVREHGYRAIALESDCLAGLVVDEYITTGAGDLDQVLATGFSHGFGASPANRELVTWLRDYNAGREPAAQVRFHGFDAPLEMMSVPSPRTALLAAQAFLAEHLPSDRVPHRAETLDTLLGADEPWASEAAVLDPEQSIGDSPQARTLRLAADDLLATFEAEAPGLRAAGSAAAYERAHLFARMAQGLLRYHAAMATPGPDRIAIGGGLRDAMMAANLLAISTIEAGRGPCLVFAHNAHLRRDQIGWQLAGRDIRWWSAGAGIAPTLRDRYIVVATDGAAPGTAVAEADPASLQGVLAHATSNGALYPADELIEALWAHPRVQVGANTDPRYAPLDPSGLYGVDAVVYLG